VNTVGIDLQLTAPGWRAPRILLTGSRSWDDEQIIQQVLFLAWFTLGQQEKAILIHGGCPTGADEMGHRTWTGVGLPVEVHPADWKQHGRRAGYVRNRAMVDAGADVCLAFIRDGSKGATMCAQMAYDAGIPLRRFER